MSNAILESIIAILEKESIQFKAVHHHPTYTSEQSAKARGEDIAIGGKAIVLKIGESFKLFVLSAALRMNSVSIKKYFQVKRMRFATKEELHDMTGLVPGCIPPFGEPILSMELFVDGSILRNERIAFNAGSLTDSIIMNTDDYLRISRPKAIFDFSIPAQSS
jgi:prolyl-tRNA editing enzyme YbaK/EbsC (Cys-tRNA(Pro) deacylase)